MKLSFFVKDGRTVVCPMDTTITEADLKQLCEKHDEQAMLLEFTKDRRAALAKEIEALRAKISRLKETT